MKKLTTIAICSAALATIASADVAGTFYSGYHTDYVYRGFDLGNNLEMFDFGLDFTGDCDCGLTWNAGIWYAATDSPETVNELDFYGSVGKSITIGGFTGDIALGYTRYTYQNNGTAQAGGDDGEVFISASTELYGLALGIQWNIGEEGVLIDEHFADSHYVELSAGYGYDLTDNLSVSLDLALGFSFGDAYGNEGLSLGQATLGAAYTVTDYLTLSAYVTTVETDEDYSGLDSTWGGLSASWAF